MARQKFEYDESGNTFLYFLLSFLAVVLIPSTYYLWPRKENEDSEKKKGCRCSNCLNKESLMKHVAPKKKMKRAALFVCLILGWILFVFLIFKVAEFDYEYANFDPYEILAIDPSTSTADIKKAYRKLSLIYHPDKETGDEKTFMKLTKAYQALTDDEARKNWERYGNPDGPGAMSFGIALPSWIVEKENSIWVLGLYALVFMIGLPTVVGMWWYRSIRYSGEQVLMDTIKLYYYYFNKTSLMNIKRVVMILGVSVEFDKMHNAEIKDRASDNVDIPKLMKVIPNLNEKNKERPLCFAYSLKARTLLYAHLSRHMIESESLDENRQYVVKKSPYLIQEMVNCISHLVLLFHAGRIKTLPSLETIDNVMRLSPMLVQALCDMKNPQNPPNPLLQLPHITEDNLRHFVTKRRQIRSIQQFMKLREDDRRALLKTLSPEQYSDCMKVAGKMPYLEFIVRSEVLDDEDSTVTVGAIVTVTAKLVRRNMDVLLNQEEDIVEEEQNEEEEVAAAAVEEKKEDVVKKPVWQKQQKKGKGRGSNKKSAKKPIKQAPPTMTKVPEQPAATESPKLAIESPKAESKERSVKKQKVKKEKDNEDDGKDSSDGGSSDSEDSEGEEGKNLHSLVDQEKDSTEDEEDGDWDKVQTSFTKKDKSLEGKSKISHTVHCPYFPEDKQEYWWVYVADKKKKFLVTAPYLVTDLVDEDEAQLKFTAPERTGVYTYTVCVRCDSYVGFDQFKDIKLDVKEAREVEEHPQWDFSEDEDDKDGGDDDESEFATDDESDPDDD